MVTGGKRRQRRSDNRREKVLYIPANVVLKITRGIIVNVKFSKQELLDEGSFRPNNTKNSSALRQDHLRWTFINNCPNNNRAF